MAAILCPYLFLVEHLAPSRGTDKSLWLWHCQPWEVREAKN